MGIDACVVIWQIMVYKPCRHVRTLNKKLGFCLQHKRRFKVKTDSKLYLPIAPNILKRTFSTSEPNKNLSKWHHFCYSLLNLCEFNLPSFGAKVVKKISKLKSVVNTCSKTTGRSILHSILLRSTQAASAAWGLQK